MTPIDLSRPVLVLVKKSFYEMYGLEQKDSRFLAMVESNSSAGRDLLVAHEENVRTIDAVISYLESSGIPYVKSVGRQGKIDGRYSLVITVGGDGTLLAASRQVLETRVVGINSRPGQSVGYFCAAHRDSFQSVLDEILSGRRESRSLARMDVHINGFRKSPPVLNDILYSGLNPAATTRYRLAMGAVEEMHRSSGIWVSTSAGSTGGIGAAGGEKVDLSNKQLQYLVREPYKPSGVHYSLDRGFFASGLAITNLMPDAMVFVDGTRCSFDVHYGDVIEPRVSAYPLHIFLQSDA
jgi:NAD+ kinase